MKTLFSLIVMLALPAAHAQSDSKGNGNGKREGKIEISSVTIDQQSLEESFLALRKKLTDLAQAKVQSGDGANAEFWTRLSPTGQQVVTRFDADLTQFMNEAVKQVENLETEILTQASKVEAVQKDRGQYQSREMAKLFDQRVRGEYSAMNTRIEEVIFSMGLKLLTATEKMPKHYQGCDTAVCIDMIRQKEKQYYVYLDEVFALRIRLIQVNQTVQKIFDRKEFWNRDSIASSGFGLWAKSGYKIALGELVQRGSQAYLDVMFKANQANIQVKE